MTFECPRCGEPLKSAPDGCRDWQCPRDTLEYLEADAEKAKLYRDEFDASMATLLPILGAITKERPTDHVDMLTGTMGVGGAAHSDALARYAADLGRPLTEVEQAAVAESEAVCERREARFAARQALLSDRERTWLGMPPKSEEGV